VSCLQTRGESIEKEALRCGLFVPAGISPILLERPLNECSH
jgi:hypothetical protein